MDNGNGHVDSSIVIASFEGVPDLRGCWGGPDGLQTFLVDWCDDLLRRNESVYTFLLGTRPSPEYSVQVLRQLCARRLRNTTAASLLIDSAIASGRCRAVWEELQQTQPTNARLASYPGISECIAEYVGFIKSRAQTKRLREFRSIIATLSGEDLDPSVYFREDWSDSDQIDMNIKI